MSNKTYPIYDVEQWKKFAIGEAESPAGVADPSDVLLTKEVVSAVVKNSADMKKREVSIIFSTDAVDRDGDVIRQRGIDFAAFRDNPVVLFAHNSRDLPIARSMKVFQTENRTRSVSIDRFTERDLNPLGDTIFRMLTHETPFLNASSIGFRPVKYAAREIPEEEKDQFFYPLEFSKIEKLEHSIVPVPANAEALQGAKSMGIDLNPIERWAEQMLDLEKAASEGFLSREHLEKCWDISRGQTRSIMVPDVERLYESALVDSTDDGEKVIIEFKGTTPADPSGFGTAEEDAEWNAPTLADFSRERFEPDAAFQERTPTARRAVASHFAWAEANPPDNFGQLKLPHHRANDSSAVLRGVNAAIAVLNGARGGVEMPEADKMAAGRHLNRHRTVGFSLEPIEIRAMDEEGIKALLEQMAAEIVNHERIGVEAAKADLADAVDVLVAEPTAVVDVAEVVAETDAIEALDEKVETVDDAAQGSSDADASFEFPSVRSEEDASRDTVDAQLQELREGQRATIGLVKQLVEAIKSVAEAGAEAEIEIEAEGDKLEGLEGLDDEFVVLLAADEAESNKGLTSAGEIGRFIANETAEAITKGFREAMGRLPN